MNRIASMRMLSRVRLPAPMALWKYYHRKLFGLHRRLLGIRRPLPPFTDYSVTADFANFMISEILEHQPSLIVEAGSGLSTIIAAYCLKQLGRGFLIALEHEKRYLELCQSAILDHQLQEYVRVVHAPLTRLKLGDREWLWYEPAFKEGVTTIDLLLVDGPPGDAQSLSRYPMLPILFDSLGDKALILMDDGARPDEKEIVARWTQEYGCFDATYIESEKGSIRLRRRPGDTSGAPSLTNRPWS